MNSLDSPFQPKIQESHYLSSENQTLPSNQKLFDLFVSLELLACFVSLEFQHRSPSASESDDPICPSGLSSSQRPNFALDQLRIGTLWSRRNTRYALRLVQDFCHEQLYSTVQHHPMDWTLSSFFVPECSPTLCDHAVEIWGSTWMRWFFFGENAPKTRRRWYDDRRRSWEPIPWFGMVPKQVAGFICLTLTWIYVSFKQPTLCHIWRWSQSLRTPEPPDFIDDVRLNKIWARVKFMLLRGFL